MYAIADSPGVLLASFNSFTILSNQNYSFGWPGQACQILLRAWPGCCGAQERCFKLGWLSLSFEDRENRETSLDLKMRLAQYPLSRVLAVSAVFLKDILRWYGRRG